MTDWKNKPTILTDWPENIDYILAIDENGITDMKGALYPTNNLLQWFTITGALFNKEEFLATKEKVTSLKFRYWEDGLFNLRRVVFHSRDIRKRIGPFNPKVIQHSDFIDDLNILLSDLDFTIYSSSIDKFAHARQYINPYPVYNLCLEFVIERFSHELRRTGSSGIILMESRGRKENQNLLKSAITLLENGNRFYSAAEFNCIKSIHFNPKRTKDKKLSFPLLELADLVSYPIHKFVRSGKKGHIFNLIESKIYNFPNYFGYGMKLFPNIPFER